MAPPALLCPHPSPDEGQHGLTRLLSIGFFALLLLVGQWPAVVQAAEMEVSTNRRGELIDVQAEAIVQAPLAIVWGTLTDYERLPEFIPGLLTSRVITRKGATATVAQTGEANFMFMSIAIEVTVESTERPPYLEVRRVAGSLPYLQGRYETQVLEGGAGVRLRWVGAISPGGELPNLVSETFVRMSIREQFAGMLREIERREVLRAQGLPWGTRPPPRPKAEPAQPPQGQQNTR